MNLDTIVVGNLCTTHADAHDFFTFYHSLLFRYAHSFILEELICVGTNSLINYKLNLKNSPQQSKEYLKADNKAVKERVLRCKIKSDYISEVFAPWRRLCVLSTNQFQRFTGTVIYEARRIDSYTQALQHISYSVGATPRLSVSRQGEKILPVRKWLEERKNSRYASQADRVILRCQDNIEKRIIAYKNFERVFVNKKFANKFERQFYTFLSHNYPDITKNNNLYAAMFRQSISILQEHVKTQAQQNRQKTLEKFKCLK